MRIVIKGTDKAAEFYRKLFYSLFAYVSNRVPEIADEIFRVDDALCAGFGWVIGPFASWDAIGLSESISSIEQEGFKLNEWVKELAKN